MRIFYRLAATGIALIFVFTFTQAQWVKTNGLSGGQINSLLTSGKSVFAATEHAMYESTNKGDGWTVMASRGISVGGSIKSLAKSGSRLFAAEFFGGFYYSDDNGGTWISSSDGITDNSLFQLAAGGSDVLAISQSGLYHSSDRGESWRDITNAIPSGWTRTVGFGPDGSGCMFASIGYGLWRSTDGGSSWAHSETGLPNVWGVDVITPVDSKLFVGLDSGGVFKSTDNGSSWTAANAGLPESAVWTITPNGTALFAGTLSQGIFRTYDDGATWSAVNTGLTNLSIYTITADAPGSSGYGLLFAGTWDGVFVSADNGDHWKPASANLYGGYAGVLAAHGNTLLAGMQDGGGIQRTTDNGNTWAAINNGISYTQVTSLAINPDHPDNFYANTWYGFIVSTDNGSSWVDRSEGLTYQSMSAFTSCPDGQGGTVLLAGGWDGFYRSTDEGMNWTLTQSETRTPRAFAVGQPDGAGARKIYAGVDSGCFYRSTDLGVTWSVVGKGLPSAGLAMDYIAELAISNGYVFAASTGDGLYRSSDDGINWSLATSGLGSYPYIAGFAVVDNTIFISTLDGVYLSINNGALWTPVSRGLPGEFHAESVYGLAVCGEYLFGGVMRNGVWRRRISEMVAVDHTPISADACTLEQNYPNPFAGHTTFRYSIAAEGPVTLRLYDVLGQPIRTLIDQCVTPGTYEIDLDGSALPEGVYFCRLDAGTTSSTKVFAKTR